MSRCHKCNGPVDVDFIGFRDDCRSCSADLHVCLNCRFYDPGKENRCREPQAESVRERDRANYCTYFRFKDEAAKQTGRTEAEKLWEDLFKKK